jgi:5-methylcytosine-specific restriction endonuclease McrA
VFDSRIFDQDHWGCKKNGREKSMKVCSYGGDDCGEPRQLYGPDGVCPKHHKRMERWGSYDPVCVVGGEACGLDIRLYGEGKCREHHYYADPKPCLEDGCDRIPSAVRNKFVGGRCEKHDQAHRAAQKRAGKVCSAHARGDCGPADRLYGGMCRKHYERLKVTDTLEPIICSVPECEVSYDTDPSGQFKAGMCNMHYLRAKRGQERVSELGVRLCPHCGGDMSTARRNSRYCSTKCQTSAWVAANIDAVRLRRRINQGKRKAAKYGNPGYEEFGIQDWIDLLETLEHRCTYCGEQSDVNDLEMDHIVPLRRGGPHRLSNITPACGSCNLSKKDRPLLFGWSPRLLGGKPRWDKSAPRGKRENKWKPEEWRDNDGPLPFVLLLAAPFPELQRAIKLTELFFLEPDDEEEPDSDEGTQSA